MTDHERILLVGCGKMGSALLDGWLGRGTPADLVSVIEPLQPQVPDGVSIYAEAAALGSDYRPSVVVFAVKPQSMDEVVPAYVQYAGPETVFLSIAAGKPIGYFAATLTDGAIVRAMPNTPAAVGRGITVLCANDLSHWLPVPVRERFPNHIVQVEGLWGERFTYPAYHGLCVIWYGHAVT